MESKAEAAAGSECPSMIYWRRHKDAASFESPYAHHRIRPDRPKCVSVSVRVRASVSVRIGVTASVSVRMSVRVSASAYSRRNGVITARLETSPALIPLTNNTKVCDV